MEPQKSLVCSCGYCRNICQQALTLGTKRHGTQNTTNRADYGLEEMGKNFRSSSIVQVQCIGFVRLLTLFFEDPKILTLCTGIFNTTLCEYISILCYPYAQALLS